MAGPEDNPADDYEGELREQFQKRDFEIITLRAELTEAHLVSEKLAKDFAKAAEEVATLRDKAEKYEKIIRPVYLLWKELNRGRNPGKPESDHELQKSITEYFFNEKIFYRAVEGLMKIIKSDKLMKESSS